jgi:hypothetical protein
MKARLLAGLVSAWCVAIASVPLHSHHSVAAGFEMSKTVTVTGTITKMEWRNPHARLSIDVKDDKGQVQNWTSGSAARTASIAADGVMTICRSERR